MTEATIHKMPTRDLSMRQVVARLEASLEGMEARYNQRFDFIDTKHEAVSSALTAIQDDLTDTRLLVAGIQGERLAEQRQTEEVKPTSRKLVAWSAIVASIMAALGSIFAMFSIQHPQPPN